MPLMQSIAMLLPLQLRGACSFSGLQSRGHISTCRSVCPLRIAYVTSLGTAYPFGLPDQDATLLTEDAGQAGVPNSTTEVPMDIKTLALLLVVTLVLMACGYSGFNVAGPP